MIQNDRESVEVAVRRAVRESAPTSLAQALCRSGQHDRLAAALVAMHEEAGSALICTLLHTLPELLVALPAATTLFLSRLCMPDSSTSCHKRHVAQLDEHWRADPTLSSAPYTSNQSDAKHNGRTCRTSA